MGFFTEFKKFAMRGNVMDMAVGIIVGGAFTPIVNSLVNDIIMPPIGLLLGGVDFSSLAVTIKHATATDPAVLVKYGVFINTMITFFIVAMAVFILIKFLNKISGKDEEEKKPAAAATAAVEEVGPTSTTAEEMLLTEIRDLLKQRK